MAFKPGKRLSANLGELRGGLVDIALSQDQQAVLEGCRRSGKKGSITLTITYEPHGPDNTEIFVTAKWTKKIPVDAGLNDKSIYLLNNNNDLVKDIAQNQPQLRGVVGGDDRADGSSPGEQRGGGYG